MFILRQVIITMSWIGLEGCYNLECAGCRETIRLLSTRYIWCPDCRAYVCLTCVKETGGKCPSCGGPALGRSLRLVLFTVVVFTLFFMIQLQINRPIDQPLDETPKMQGIYLGTIVAFGIWLALLVAITVLLFRRRHLHNKFISTHDILHFRDVDTLRQRAEQGIR
jgi:hypothetical protein